MAVLIDDTTKVICQGLTGSTGCFRSVQTYVCSTRMGGSATLKKDAAEKKVEG